MGKELPKRCIIIGAGASGAFAARRLKQIAEKEGKAISIVMLEKEPEVGGKCSTYIDSENLVTERGAGVLAPNYGVVLDAFKENHLEYEPLLPTDDSTIELEQYFKQLSLSGKLSAVLTLSKEYLQFLWDYKTYFKAKRDNTDLPALLKKPFQEYADERGMTLLPLLARPFIPGFGYGDNRDIATYYVLEYFGRYTILDLLAAKILLGKPPLLAIKGGFQRLIQKIAADFEVHTSVNIQKITRKPDEITVEYQDKDGNKELLKGDMLILATSPVQWQSMGLDATPIEQACMDQVRYNRYPIAVCKIKGLPPQQRYFTSGLVREGFGHLALTTTRDNRPEPEDGRLCTIYVNLPRGPNTYKMDKEALTIELMSAIPSITDVQFLEEKIWEDYMSTVPWELRQELYTEQMQGKTLHLSGCFSFEDVAAVANAATDTINQYLGRKNNFVETQCCANFRRARHFFYSPHHSPICTEVMEEHSSASCV